MFWCATNVVLVQQNDVLLQQNDSWCPRTLFWCNRTMFWCNRTMFWYNRTMFWCTKWQAILSIYGDEFRPSSVHDGYPSCSDVPALRFVSLIIFEKARPADRFSVEMVRMCHR